MRNNIYASDTEGREFKHSEKVGRCIVCNPWRLQRAQWGHHVDGKRIDHGNFKKAKDQHTRSFTESELVGVHDMAPQMLWTRYFLKLKDTYILLQAGRVSVMLNQDNNSMSAMYVTYWRQTGKNSAAAREPSTCINVRYVF
jgi:hypothetical protein